MQSAKYKNYQITWQKPNKQRSCASCENIVIAVDIGEDQRVVQIYRKGKSAHVGFLITKYAAFIMIVPWDRS